MTNFKKKRIVNKELLRSYHGKKCEVKDCNSLGVPHHIKTRGSGGDDVAENLICLCIEHHTEIHKIGKDTFSSKYGMEIT